MLRMFAITVSLKLGFHFRLFLTFCTRYLQRQRSYLEENTRKMAESTENTSGKISSQTHFNLFLLIIRSSYLGTAISRDHVYGAKRFPMQ